MTPDEIDYTYFFQTVYDWDIANRCPFLVLTIPSKREAVKVANFLRRQVYRVTVVPFFDCYRLEVERVS